ncbi:MAG: DUF2877 domain-containing protein, partial [Armatimonadota bacterium]|nr:DUF2877 domain-containing protein [Armatimonadota bacterium]
AGTPPFASLHPGVPVTVLKRELRLGPLRVDLHSAIPWNPVLPPLQGSADAGMRVVETQLRREAPAEGLARLLDDPAAVPDSPLLQHGRRALAHLRRGLAAGDAAAVTAAAASLAGLGPGLTPSGDDVLAGLLLGMRLWPAAAGPLGLEAVAALIVGAAAPRTGRISRAYLGAARQGHAAGAWHDLVRALPVDPAAAAAAAARIRQTGETSGADMLAGFLLAWRW